MSCRHLRHVWQCVGPQHTAPHALCSCTRITYGHLCVPYVPSSQVPPAAVAEVLQGALQGYLDAPRRPAVQSPQQPQPQANGGAVLRQQPADLVEQGRAQRGPEGGAMRARAAGRPVTAGGDSDEDQAGEAESALELQAKQELFVALLDRLRGPDDATGSVSVSRRGMQQPGVESAAGASGAAFWMPHLVRELQAVLADKGVAGAGAADAREHRGLRRRAEVISYLLKQYGML